MIFKNINFHNVSYLSKDKNGGYVMHRLPKFVEEVMSDGGRIASEVTTGVELRFKMVSDSVKLFFRLDAPENSSTTVHIYRGGMIGATNEASVAVVGGKVCEISVSKSENISDLHRITQSESFAFSPEVIRIVCNSSRLRFVDVEGDIVSPEKADLPKKTYLAYGSSITHGSTSLNMPYSFVSIIGEYFGVDTRNLGIAGNAKLQPELISEIAEMGVRGEWDFASFCMGINILEIDTLQFEDLVKNVIHTVAKANPTKHIFCISPFYCNKDIDGSDKPRLFRKIIDELVHEYNSPFVHYINGAKIMDGAWGLSADLVHPSPIGIRAISNGLIEEYSRYVGVNK